jgi:hypothetical protein
MRKKWLIRATVLLGVCVATLLIAAPAMAIWDWCDVDPTLSIGGHTVSLDASYQGDPSQIRGKIEFTVEVPAGTQVKLISCDSTAQVKIVYDKCNDNRDNNENGNGRQNDNRDSYHKSSKGTSVEVSVDIKSKTAYASLLTVSLDGKKITLQKSTTDKDLDYSFVIA